MRLLAPAWLVLAVFPSACGYPCVEQCRSIRTALAENGYNPDEPSGSGGLDPEEVCDREAIQQATTCDECRAAFAEEFRLLPERLMCDCPADGDQIFLFDEDCTPQTAALDEATCAEANSREQDARVQQCLAP